MSATTTFVSRRTTCRLCDSPDVVLVLPIKPSPIADAYVRAEQLDRPQPEIPLDLYQCQRCGHVQNLDIVDADLLFRDYIFYTSSSLGLVEHFRRYVDTVVADCGIATGSLVVEIGSNDGTMLRFFKERGMRVLGVDPAREIAKQASDAGLPTVPEFFTSRLAEQIRGKEGPADLIVANNVYAHADQLGDLTRGIASLLKPDGVFVFEVSYLLDMVDKLVFDTVYHEHLSYHSIEPLSRFFVANGLHLFDVRRIESKGGSFRGFAQLAAGRRAEEPIVAEMIANERRRGLHCPAIFKDFETRILERKAALQDFVADARRAGRTIAAYGASNTVTTLMYHFEVQDAFEYLIDDNVRKHGMFSPGSHLQVKPSSVLYDDPPGVVVVMAWQFSKPIIAKHQKYVDNGGQFVVPLPELTVVESGR